MMKNGVLAGITAIQPVYAGGQIINGNRLAKIGVEASKLQLEQSENQVNLTTEQYYWQIISIGEKLKTLNVIDNMLEKLLKDVSAAVNAGITMRNDLLQVQLKKNEIESTRINAENGLNIMKMVLAQYIGSKGTDYELVNEIY